jgi:hypothetical protein
MPAVGRRAPHWVRTHERPETSYRTQQLRIANEVLGFFSAAFGYRTGWDDELNKQNGVCNPHQIPTGHGRRSAKGKPSSFAIGMAGRPPPQASA